MNNKPVAWMNKEANVFAQHEEGAKNFGCTIPLYTHPVKELHLSLQKSKQTGELLAVTYTDDEHRIVEVLWQRPPVKELTDEEIDNLIMDVAEKPTDEDLYDFAKAILRKAQK